MKKSKTKVETEEMIIEELTPPVPKKRGRKTKYNPEFCDIILEVAERGGHKAEMSRLMGINEDTFTEWCKTYPEFGRAWTDSKTISKAFYENLLLKAACGQIDKFNFNSVAMIMNNKFGDEYRRSANGGAGNTHVEITNNTLTMADTRSIDEQIAHKLQHLNSLGLQLNVPLLIEQDDDDEDSDED
jgi:hypothetical protein